MCDVMERISKVFISVFNKEGLTISEETCSDDIEGWDSLKHITLIAMLEQEFQLEFDIDQIVEMENVGDMKRIIESIIG